MKRIVVAIPHSHTWFWTQTCVASLVRNPPRASGFDVEVVVVDNSLWSPAIKGITETGLGDAVRVIPNHKSNKFHASALDCIVDRCDFDIPFDYLMALETDVIALRPTWLQWFVDQMRPTDYVVGMWHHEQFINPSCTLYQASALREMAVWCKTHAPQDELRWGSEFSLTAPLDNNLPLSENPAAVLQGLKDWISGPFAEKRGWPAGTSLKEKPSGQEKGPGWYEPGQQLHHWAVDAGYTYTVCPTFTSVDSSKTPVSTFYGPAWETKSLTDSNECRQLEYEEMLHGCPEEYGDGSCAFTVHLWGGTRALDILKHPVTCEFVKSNTPKWLAREARFWRQLVPPDVQALTLELIRQYDWHTTGQGSDHVSDRDREAVEFVRSCYKKGGVEW